MDLKRRNADSLECCVRRLLVVDYYAEMATIGCGCLRPF
jgi:hypothetical protein